MTALTAIFREQRQFLLMHNHTPARLCPLISPISGNSEETWHVLEQSFRQPLPVDGAQTGCVRTSSDVTGGSDIERSTSGWRWVSAAWRSERLGGFHEMWERSIATSRQNHSDSQFGRCGFTNEWSQAHKIRFNISSRLYKNLVARPLHSKWAKRPWRTI